MIPASRPYTEAPVYLQLHGVKGGAVVASAAAQLRNKSRSPFDRGKAAGGGAQTVTDASGC